MIKKYSKRLFYSAQWLSLKLRLFVCRRVLGKSIVFIFGTPTHTNIGDLAIALAEVSFVNNIKHYRAIAVSVTLMNLYKSQIPALVADQDALSLHGGGNMGDTYPEEEELRRHVIKTFKSHSIFIFPQTIYFSNTTEGVRLAQESSSAYALHPNLTIVARETKTKEIADELFNRNTVHLTPDIVLSYRALVKKSPRKGVVTCLRNDIEKVLDDRDYAAILKLAAQVSSKITETDTVSSDPLFRFRGKKGVVLRKLSEFKKAELVITDRLHGMVFAAITGTPCIVFSNFNHKVRGTYQWIEDLGYIKFCDTIEDMNLVNPRLLIAAAKEYDPAKFESYWKIIETLVKGKA